jgi:hypothetical protein
MKQLNPGLHHRGKRSFLCVAVCLFFLLLSIATESRAQVTNIVLSPNTGSYCQGDSVSINFTIAGISLLPTTTIEIYSGASSLATLSTGTTLLSLGGGQFSAKVVIPAGVAGTSRYFKISYTGVLIGSGSGNSSTFTLYAPTVGGTVSSAQTICSGTSPSNLTLSGHTGSVVKWQRATDAAFTSPTDIAITSATLTSANIGNLTVNTYFRAVVQNGNCTAANSSSVLITMRPNPAGTLSTVVTPICAGTQAQLRFTSSAGTGPFSLIINGTTYNSITSGTAFNVTPNIITTTTFNLTKITDANGCILQNP